MKKVLLLLAGIFIYAFSFGGNSPIPSSANSKKITLEKLSDESILPFSKCYPGKDKVKTVLFPYEESYRFVLVR